MENALLRIFGVAGVLLFLPLFLLTFVDPHVLEKAGAQFIEAELRKETDSAIASIRLPETSRLEAMLGEKAANLRRQAEEQLEIVKAQLQADAPKLVSEQLGKLKNWDCTCRKKWEDRLRLELEMKSISLAATREKLIAFSHAKYMDIVQQLTVDVRIFLFANLWVFLFLLAASCLKSRAARHLLLPGSLLLLSTLICSYFYLFEQNWFYTIIYNDYTGFAFIGYQIVVFALLCDVVFNGAQVTTAIINSILNALGQAASMAPC